jgi:hypothetical protein
MLFSLNLNAVLNPHGIYVYPFGGVIGRSPADGSIIRLGDWQAAGLTNSRVTVSDFDNIFPEVTGNAEVIHFNLEGIQGDYVDFANLSAGVFDLSKPITATELYIVRNNPELCRKTVFYEQGSLFPPVPSPQAKLTVCGL